MFLSALQGNLRRKEFFGLAITGQPLSFLIPQETRMRCERGSRGGGKALRG